MKHVFSILLLTPYKYKGFHIDIKNLRGFTNKIFMKKGVFNNEIFFTPKTANQKKYVEYLNNYKNDLVIAVGPAGSGKTMFACLKAIESLKKNLVSRIVVTRPVVPVEEDIGFLPGNIVKKMDPWTRPIFDIFLEYYSQNEITQMINNGIIEISPLAYMRGRTFKNAFIIADEMQNSSPNQMMMLTTRIGTNSRMVVTGDLQQSDKLIDNGLKDFINKLELYNSHFYNISENHDIQIIKLDSSDVLRSEVVEKVLKMYNFKITRNVTKDEKKNNSNDAALIPFSHINRELYKLN
jgi:phosphate starvation-inducible PhoH-like protein